MITRKLLKERVDIIVRSKNELIVYFSSILTQPLDKANENIKRLMNQSIFRKIWINPDGSVEPKMTKICEGVFEAKRDIKKSAPTAVDADSIRKLFKSGSNFFEQGLNNDFLVEHRGIEPLTSRLRTWRSPS